MSETTTFMLYGWAECLPENIDNFVIKVNKMVEEEIEKYWNGIEGLSEEEGAFGGNLETPFHVVKLGNYDVVVGAINRCLPGNVVQFFKDKKVTDSIVWKEELDDVFLSTYTKYEEE